MYASKTFEKGLVPQYASKSEGQRVGSTHTAVINLTKNPNSLVETKLCIPWRRKI